MVQPKSPGERVRAWASRCALFSCSLLACAGCGSDKVLGEQCPSPLTGNATVAPLPDGSEAPLAAIYGTSCAPCDEPETEKDADGCPVYVTFDTCGGDICIGTRVISFAADAGMGDADAAMGDEDAGGDGDGDGDGDADGGIDDGTDAGSDDDGQDGGAP